MAERALMDEMRWARMALAACGREEQSQLVLASRSARKRATHKFGELRRPQACRDALLPRDPVGIDIDEASLRGATFGRSERSD
jgi:hypothetical protein